MVLTFVGLSSFTLEVKTGVEEQSVFTEKGWCIRKGPSVSINHDTGIQRQVQGKLDEKKEWPLGNFSDAGVLTR